MLSEFENTVQSFSSLLVAPLLKPLVSRVEEKISVGLTIINWNSMNIKEYIAQVTERLEELKLVWKRVSCCLCDVIILPHAASFLSARLCCQ